MIKRRGGRAGGEGRRNRAGKRKRRRRIWGREKNFSYAKISIVQKRSRSLEA